MILDWILLLVIAALSYALGSMSTLVLASNFVFRASLSRLGRGNTWLSNFRRVYGVGGFIKLFLVEAVRDALPIVIGGLLMSIVEHPEAGRAFAGFCLVLGRVFPVFYNFKGSHASLCLVAAAFAADISVGVVVLLVVAAVTWFSRYFSLGAVVGAFFLVISAVLVIDDTLIIWLMVFTAGLVLIKHIPAISRMLNGKEERFSTEKDISYKFDERF